MRQLSGSDAYFLYSDKPGKHQHVSTIYIYDQSTAPEGEVRFKSILQHVKHRLCTSRLFRQKLVHVPFNLDYPYWIEDPHFELEFHVRHIALPHPGDWRQFCIQVARLHSRPLDMNRPVWEMYVIEGLDNIPLLPEGAFAEWNPANQKFEGVDGDSSIQAIKIARRAAVVKMRVQFCSVR